MRGACSLYSGSTSAPRDRTWDGSHGGQWGQPVIVRQAYGEDWGEQSRSHVRQRDKGRAHEGQACLEDVGQRERAGLCHMVDPWELTSFLRNSSSWGEQGQACLRPS